MRHQALRGGPPLIIKIDGSSSYAGNRRPDNKKNRWKVEKEEARKAWEREKESAED